MGTAVVMALVSSALIRQASSGETAPPEITRFAP